MINKIGAVYQDSYSRGFLLGLKARLDCQAEFLIPEGNVGRNKLMKRKQALLAWTFFREAGVDLVVRFTDADRDRWQEVKRRELSVFPQESRAFLVCGVAVNNPEEWMARTPWYLAEQLDLDEQEITNAQDASSVVKKAIDRRATRESASCSSIVERLVKDAPAEVFRRWLQDEALQDLYDECRSAALRQNCHVPNERNPDDE